MKIHVCDVCKKEGKLEEATQRIGVKKGMQKITIDTCDDHIFVLHQYLDKLEIYLPKEL